MLTVTRVLCPTDFSEASCEAIKMAQNIALHFSAQLTVVHVVPPVIPLPDAVAAPSFDIRIYEESLLRGMESKLHSVVTTLVSNEVVVRPVTLSGRPAETIVDLADQEKADLIVIATHGMTGWRHYAYGSVAQKVIQHTNCPVLLVHGSAAKQ